MKKELRILKKIIWYCFDTSIFLTTLLILASVLVGLVSTVRVWTLGQIVNQLRFDPGLITLLAVTLLIREAAISFGYYLRQVLAARIKLKMKTDLLRTVNTMPPLIQEINDTQLKIGRAFDFINHHFETSLSSVWILTADFISVISVTALLLNYSWLFPVLAGLSAVFIIQIRLKQDAAMHAMYKTQYPNVQLGNYYLNALTKRESVLELRLLKAQTLFTEKFLRISQQNLRERTNYFMEHAYKGSLLEALVLVAGNFLSLVWAVLLLAVSPDFTIGTLSIVINGILTAQNDLIAFAFNGKYIYQAVLYGEDYWELCEDYQHAGANYQSFERIHAVELKNVYFKYPNSDVYALKNINLKLKLNETLGITGANGSGKSTLCKIILGIYQPTKGEIWVNGENVTNKNYILRDSGTVFQDFVRYELTPGDNIFFGCVQKGYDQMEIMEAAEKAGAHEFITKLPDQYAAPIGTLYENSTYLSGGQWQRLAVARGLYADGSFVVLDEPNASMDPQMEATLFKQFQEIITKKDCIGVLISHRLGSTKNCGQIIVMEAGEIIEAGTYQELMNLGGQYSQMYTAQSQLYTKA